MLTFSQSSFAALLRRASPCWRRCAGRRAGRRHVAGGRWSGARPSCSLARARCSSTSAARSRWTTRRAGALDLVKGGGAAVRRPAGLRAGARARSPRSTATHENGVRASARRRVAHDPGHGRRRAGRDRPARRTSRCSSPRCGGCSRAPRARRQLPRRRIGAAAFVALAGAHAALRGLPRGSADLGAAGRGPAWRRAVPAGAAAPEPLSRLRSQAPRP